MNLLERIYYTGLRCDRALTQSVQVPRPVISVGNIAVGGRGKTPFVIDLCCTLKKAGYDPVVLTRGYGKAPGFLGKASGTFLTPTAHLSCKDVIKVSGGCKKGPWRLYGDEPCEIHLLAGVDVLVSANRARAAANYLKASPTNKKIVFVLDDGFQHWKLQRDFDIVLIHPRDRSGRLLPVGRLREPASALDRADLIFEDGVNLHKRTVIPESLARDKKIYVITTRAGSQESYMRAIQKTHPHAELHALRDHASEATLRQKIHSFPASSLILLGWKEAVKIFSWPELETLRTTKNLHNIWIADVKLDFDHDLLLQKIRDKLQERSF